MIVLFIYLFIFELEGKFTEATAAVTIAGKKTVFLIIFVAMKEDNVGKLHFPAPVFTPSLGRVSCRDSPQEQSTMFKRKIAFTTASFLNTRLLMCFTSSVFVLYDVQRGHGWEAHSRIQM